MICFPLRGGRDLMHSIPIDLDLFAISISEKLITMTFLLSKTYFTLCIKNTFLYLYERKNLEYLLFGS